jgi:type I restriction enzyme S subunit
MVRAPTKTAVCRVRFRDVARLCTDRCADPAAEGMERYVGLEHLEPGDLRIRKWGLVADGTTFTNRFRPGQVLFGKRRAYQRKVAVADFAGVCSGDIYVLEPANGSLVPELLPFLCQTDAFFEHAIGTSAGSLSPRTNWRSLGDFEFALPPLDEQRSIVHLLRAVESVLEARRKVTIHATALLRSGIDAMFEAGVAVDGGQSQPGEPSNRWIPTELSAVTNKIVDGVHKRPDYVDSGVPFLTVENLTSGPDIEFSITRFITQSDHQEFSKRANPERGDVLVSKDGTLGVARVIEADVPFSIFVSVALLKPKRELVDPWFLRYFFDSKVFCSRLASKTSGSALKHIHLVDFRSTIIPLPPLHLQRRIVSTLRSLDRAARRASGAIIEAERLKKCILGTLR